MRETKTETSGEDLESNARRDFIRQANQHFATFLCPIHDKPSTMIEDKGDSKTAIRIVGCCDEHTRNTIAKFGNTPEEYPAQHE